VASLAECLAAVGELATRLGDPDNPTRGLPDRTLGCVLTDLDVTISGRFDNGRLVDVGTDPRPRAQIRLTTTSDDLVALTRGELDFAHAWARRRVRLDAGLGDLLKLRALL